MGSVCVQVSDFLSCACIPFCSCNIIHPYSLFSLFINLIEMLVTRDNPAPPCSTGALGPPPWQLLHLETFGRKLGLSKVFQRLYMVIEPPLAEAMGTVPVLTVCRVYALVTLSHD